MLKKLGSEFIIDRVISRTQQATSLAKIILAIPNSKENDALQERAMQLGVKVYRGDETDVLGRFCNALSNIEADAVVRVCADNPFIAPEEIERLISFFQQNSSLDYAFNHIPKLDNQYPDGLGAEIINADLLFWLNGNATTSEAREHVTRYLWDNNSDYKIGSFKAPASICYPEVKLDVDTAEDYQKLALLADATNLNSTAEEIVASYLRLMQAETQFREFSMVNGC
jgi:spore coat polysaccharide biosynthesis protein SpsF